MCSRCDCVIFWESCCFDLPLCSQSSRSPSIRPHTHTALPPCLSFPQHHSELHLLGWNHTRCICRLKIPLLDFLRIFPAPDLRKDAGNGLWTEMGWGLLNQHVEEDKPDLSDEKLRSGHPSPVISAARFEALHVVNNWRSVRTLVFGQSLCCYVV